MSAGACLASARNPRHAEAEADGGALVWPWRRSASWWPGPFLAQGRWAWAWYELGLDENWEHVARGEREGAVIED
jgi:hypothetical protein